MNINKCISCKYFESFFGACTLYQKEVYLGEGEFEYGYFTCKEIEPEECEYERIG